jgi:hypothetical protein
MGIISGVLGGIFNIVNTFIGSSKAKKLVKEQYQYSVLLEDKKFSDASNLLTQQGALMKQQEGYTLENIAAQKAITPLKYSGSETGTSFFDQISSGGNTIYYLIGAGLLIFVFMFLKK